MSKGKRFLGGYQSVIDPSAIYKISLHKEVTEFSLNGIVNSFPSQAINRQESVRVDQSRQHGIRPFFVQIIWDNFSPPLGYHEAGWLWIPLINANIRGAIDGVNPLTGIYLGKAVNVHKTRPEEII